MDTVTSVIEHHHDEIVELWTDAARHTPFAAGLSAIELHNMIPAYLSSLGHGGAPAAAALTVAQRDLIERHTGNRLRQGFVLNEILTEFALLGRSIGRVIDRELADERPDADDRARLAAELHLATREVTKIFTEHMLEDAQAEKRAGRLLHQLATPTPGAPRATNDPITELLDVVMTALGACTAALRLFDPADGRLVLSAAAGHASAQVERCLRAADPGLAPSRAGDATFLSGPAVLGGATQDALRRLGVHSLIGVGVAAHPWLHGVLHVGFAQPRDTTASDLRRLEGIGGALIEQLDHSRLRAELDHALVRLRAGADADGRIIDVVEGSLRGQVAVARSDARAADAPDDGEVESRLRSSATSTAWTRCSIRWSTRTASGSASGSRSASNRATSA
jgi:hypothetical protein